MMNNMEVLKPLLVFIFFVLPFHILFDIYHIYAYKRCIRFRRCREWICKYYHDCEYANKRD